MDPERDSVPSIPTFAQQGCFLVPDLHGSRRLHRHRALLHGRPQHPAGEDQQPPPPELFSQSVSQTVYRKLKERRVHMQVWRLVWFKQQFLPYIKCFERLRAALEQAKKDLEVRKFIRHCR